MKSKYTKSIILGILFILFAGIKPLLAQDVTEPEPFISTGNTAWMMLQLL
jgi:hypothetical protein